MSIKGVGSTKSTTATDKAKRKKTAGSDGAGFAGLVQSGASVEAAEAATGRAGASGVSALDALLALQEVDADADTGHRAAQARHQAEDLLKRLDLLRLAILEGRVPPPLLQEIARSAAAQQKTDGLDAALSSILRDISLRAQIELAKLGY